MGTYEETARNGRYDSERSAEALSKLDTLAIYVVTGDIDEDTKVVDPTNDLNSVQTDYSLKTRDILLNLVLAAA